MQRETATQFSEIPHAFVGASNDVCRICGGQGQDERHLEWSRVARASRETAAEQEQTSIRELGS
jgi:hypothetical protein